MSRVKITDKRGGVFEVRVEFSYNECDRLPYNALRKVAARIEQVKNGGISATSEFNVRDSKEAASLIEVLDLFGLDGSYVHASTPASESLTQAIPRPDVARAKAAASNARPPFRPEADDVQDISEAEDLVVETAEPGDLAIESGASQAVVEIDSDAVPGARR